MLILKKEHGIAAAPVNTNLSPEELEEERAAEQSKIDDAVPLTEEEQQEKDELAAEGFESWSRRDFQQFVRALENHGWRVFYAPQVDLLLILWLQD